MRPPGPEMRVRDVGNLVHRVNRDETNFGVLITTTCGAVFGMTDIRETMEQVTCIPCLAERKLL